MSARTVIAQIIHEEWLKHWTPTLEDADLAAERILATLADRDALCPDSGAHDQLTYHGHNRMLRVQAAVEVWKRETGHAGAGA